MLQESFVLLPGVRQATERKFWAQGVSSWSDFVSSSKVKGVGKARKERCDRLLTRAERHRREQNAPFFYHALPFSDQWRLYDEFKDEAVYLDIETDGYRNGITVIGLSDGVEAKTMVRGFNFNKRLLMEELAKYKMVVTFNGASFDIPIIERYFGIKIRLPHLDLRFAGKRIGLSGGLKSIERQLNIKRRDEVNDMSGEDAVYLWEMWKLTGNRDYLNKLVWYNEEDILNLKPLAKYVIPRLWEKTRAGAVLQRG